MVYIDNISILPNPSETNRPVTVSIELHDEYPDTKQYEYRYPYRYGNPQKSN